MYLFFPELHREKNGSFGAAEMKSPSGTGRAVAPYCFGKRLAGFMLASIARLHSRHSTTMQAKIQTQLRLNGTDRRRIDSVA